ADKVDSVNVVSADEDARDSEDHESYREDEGRFLKAEEIDFRVFDQRHHRQFRDVIEVDQEFEEESADDERAENGGENTDREGDSETFYRSGSDENQNRGGEKGGDVGVDDGRKRFLVTRGE